MRTWTAASLLALLFGSSLLVTSQAIAQTQRAPKPPIQADPVVEPPRVQEAVTCKALYDAIRTGYANLQNSCSDPDGFRGELLRLFSVRKQWVEKGCYERTDVPPNLTQVARQMLEDGIPSQQARCFESCLDEATRLLEGGRCSDAGSQCEACCAFSLQGGLRTCDLGCKRVELACREEMARRIADEAKSAAQSAKDQFKEALRLLQEHADRQIANMSTISSQ